MTSIPTPLRYPGGKTKLFDFVVNVINRNNLVGCTYMEPFVGGAGLAVKLLLNGIVERIIINDINFAIYDIWDSILNRTAQLCDFISTVPLNISEWNKQRSIFNNHENFSVADVGLAAFYLNRTNISGVFSGGVIGGISQEGTYKIDARFNRTELIKRINRIAERRDSIELYNWDAKDFIRNVIPNYQNSFIYFDPPYVQKGHYLYENSFSKDDHKVLFDAIIECPQNWIVTYDNCDLINDLYADYRKELLTVKYSAGKTKSGDEIIIYSNNLVL